MTDNKLFKSFLSLSGVEKREGSKLLESPFFNHKLETTRLWKWLLVQKRQSLGSKGSIENAFSHVFPGQKFDAVQWRHLQSKLNRLIEQLLEQRAIAQQPLAMDLKLIPVLRQKKLAKAVSSAFQRAEDRLNKLPPDIDYYHYQYQLEWEKYASFGYLERGGKNNLAELGHSLDVYLIASKLRLACMMASHQAVYQVDYDSGFFPAILKYVESTNLMEVPAIALYFYCYQAITSGTESDFYALRKELKNKQEDMPKLERNAFLTLAINYCIKQLNLGKDRFIREALDLYRTGLETKTLIINDNLSRFAYKNIVALGLKLDEYDWVNTFINDYAPYLEEAHRASNQNYNMARLFFAKKEFQKAMPMLARIDDKDLLLKLDSKVMLLKMYYEMEEFDALDSLLSSFKMQLLRKKKVIGYHQLHYLNIVKFTQKMCRLNRNDKEKVQALRKEVEENTMVIEKEWLLERIGF